MLEVNTKEIEIKEKTGTWSQSRKLLIDCESNHSYGYSMKLSKNLKNIYKVMAWLEEKNKIVNHKIEKNIKIFVPKELDDYIIIIASEIPLAKEAKYEKEDFEIKYDDTVIFQHKCRPGKNRGNENITSEDMISRDLTSEEIVKKNPMLYSFFNELNHFKNLRESHVQELLQNGLSPNENTSFQEIENRIEYLKHSIIKNAKESTEWLIKTCTIDDHEWQTLAFKLYKRFCKNDNSDYKDDKLLNKLFTEHSKTQECIKKFRERFEIYLKKYKYDIVMFNIDDFSNSIYGKYLPKEKGVKRPMFGNYFTDSITGPMLCFHDTQGFDVVAKNIKIKNEKFFCDLVFDFYDHFGLDSQDLVSFDWIPSVRIGFQGWYILQHFKDCETGCKAFVNHANFSEKVEVQIES